MSKDGTRAALALVPLLGLLLAVGISAYRSFDAPVSGDYGAHLDYLRYVEHHRSLPRADQGFEMYHPPAYYVTSVVLFDVVHPVRHDFTLTDAGRSVATGAWVMEGLAAAAIVWALGAPWPGMAAAAAVAWLLPGQVNVATRIYPETMAGLGVAVLLLGVIELENRRPWAYAWLAVGFPLAALSKYSGLVAAAAVVPLALWVGRRRWRPLLLALAPGAALVGAFYLRNLVLFGTPTPLNADLFHLSSLGGLYARRPPGFFTSLSLGRCAAEHSFYGSAWKWLWATDCGVKAPFRGEVAGWLLLVALVTSGLALAGWGRAVWRGRRSMAWGALAVVPAAVLAAFVYYNVQVPSGSSGLYLLVAIVPVASAVGALSIGILRPRAQLVAYAAVLGWGVTMAHACGVG